MQTENLEGQESIFGRDSGFGKMSSALSQVGGTLKRVKKSLGRIFKRSSKRSSKLKNHTFMLLDLRPGAGNMLGAYWEYDPPWLGSFGTPNTSECPKDAVECSLWQILQATAPSRYSLSQTACLGILRRAACRGKSLPPLLEAALRMQAGLDPPAPISGEAKAYHIENMLHLQISEEQKSNADSIYNLVRYGVAGGSEGWIPGADVPFIGADGFCSPIGSGWERRVTSEFGNRIDPITGKRKGHTGMDLAVPTGTPIRTALPGTVTVSKYNAGGYGYYVMIEHGNGIATLYGHCSKLLARVGQTVQAGDIIALSGSTGRSTGPHLHFEVRVNGERTNPRAYLPKG